jgi:hypothetical protein
MSKRSREDYDNPVQNENEKLQGSRESTSSPSDSTVYFGPNSKLVHVDNGDGTAAAPEEVMRCSLPPHVQTPISFTSFEDYEVHYNKAHVNRCVECRKNFPTAHFLDLHISENHNPLLGILRDRGEHTVSIPNSCPTVLASTPRFLKANPYVVRLLRGRLRAQMSHAAEASHAPN